MPAAPQTHPNPDLFVGADRRPRWNSPPFRRQGFQEPFRQQRYTVSARAGRIMDLRLSADLGVAAREDVRRLTASPWFSAMAVIEGNRLIHEAYAPDFGPGRVHSIMSISKMSMNLIIGRLWDEGRIDTGATVGSVLPWIGPGYHATAIADVLNMNVQNGYDEDYTNPDASVFRYDAAFGARLAEGREQSAREFLASIDLLPGTSDTSNPTGACLYKSANTDILGLIAEAAGGQSLASLVPRLADAAGVEHILAVGTDRTGFPGFSGGICLTARDLCRYGAIFARMGQGVDGRPFGSARFLEATLKGGVPMPAPRAHLRYSNQTNTNGIWVGHGGYGGQYLVANPQTGRVACYLSVMQNEAGYDSDYYPPIIAMLADICAGG